MPHKLIETTKLHFQDGYNIIRTPKEAKENAADVEKQMEQMGDVPEMFPVNFVTIDGKLFTRNHSTLQAALNRNWPKVYAMESPHEAGSAADILDLILSNNRSHPVSRAKQGEVYKMLRDGEGPGPEEIAACKTGEEPANKRDPMTLEEIAAACQPVYSAAHIGHCITLAESSPEIQELMEQDLVSAGIVIKAAQWSKDKKTEDVNPAKQLRILKAAIRQANDEGAKRATQKHMDAIKSQFVTLKAAGGEEKKDTKKGANGSTEASSGPATGSEDENKGDGAELPGGDEQEEQETELFPQAAEVLTEGSKKNEKLVEALATAYTDEKWLKKNDLDMILSTEEAERLAGATIEIVANAAEVF